MKPRRTAHSNFVFALEGGADDNNLWVQRALDIDGLPVLRSCWVPTDEERKVIADGANIDLSVWGSDHPPVALAVVSYPLLVGAKP